MSSPQVTIGLPVYNGENFLRQAMDSLLAQSFTDFELIVSDNCSSDATPEICNHYTRLDPRVVYYRNERNIGAARNFNRVGELARGRFFAWANHDDLWNANYVERCVSSLQARTSAVLAYSRSRMIDAHGEPIANLLDNLQLDANRPSERLRRFHELQWAPHDKLQNIDLVAYEGIWIPVYGIIRTEFLRKTRMIGRYISSDTILLEELLMHGKFVEVEERMFFKRDHADRSMQACRSYDNRIQWFTGKPTPCPLFPLWRLFYERLRTTKRTPMSVREQAACYAEMLRFYASRACNRAALRQELWINLRRSFAGSKTAKELPKVW